MSLIDYPGKISAIIFTQGCVWRCGYCHNPELVDPGQFQPALSQSELLDFLADRKKLLDGVVITGGEPTLHPDLIGLIREIKELGYAVKLDTNGIFPVRLKEIAEAGLVDYIAMDIKAPPGSYQAVVNAPRFDFKNVLESIEIIMGSGIDYEFRSTMIDGIHKKKDVISMVNLIKGAKRYYLQKFRNQGKMLDQTFKKFRAFTDREMAEMVRLCRPYVENCEARG